MDETEEISCFMVSEAGIQDQCQYGLFLQRDIRGRCLPGPWVQLGVFCLCLPVAFALFKPVSTFPPELQPCWIILLT